MSTEAARNYRIQAVFDSFKVLERLVLMGRPMSASQLSSETGESRNRVFRILKTLEELGYVLGDSQTNSFRPTLRLLTLGQHVSNSKGIEDIAGPIMQRLRDQTGETVYLSFREMNESVCIMRFESSRMLRITAQRGQRWPLGIGAAGTALLLHAPIDVREQVFASLSGLSNRWGEILDLYERERVVFADGRMGFTADNGVFALGTPVGPTGDYALCLAWPISHTEATREILRDALLEAADQINRLLGHEITSGKGEVWASDNCVETEVETI